MCSGVGNSMSGRGQSRSPPDLALWPVPSHDKIPPLNIVMQRVSPALDVLGCQSPGVPLLCPCYAGRNELREGRMKQQSPT